jgi:hypothetical protein
VGTDTTLAVTPGSGTTLKVYAQTSGGSIQYVRTLDGTAVTHGSWTLSAAATTSAIAADVTRVGLVMMNNGTLNVYLRYDATAPTITVNHCIIAPGGYYEVPEAFHTAAVSFISTGTGGALTYAASTAA